MHAAPRRLNAELIVDLRSAFEGWPEPMAVDVGWDGAVYAAARRSTESLRIVDRSGASFAKSQLTAPTAYRVVRWREGELTALELRDETLPVSHVQPTANGVLLVAARCAWSATGEERNAVAVDWSGRVLRRLTLGDSIADLRTTREGATWVSFFDEGVFGNHGWGGPGPAPIGQPGLIAFDSEGRHLFAYDSAAAKTDSICDAYALNVTLDGDAWVYFYVDFPIVRVRGGEYRAWSCEVEGARAMAIRDSRVLLFDDYDHQARGRILRLGDDGVAKTVDEVQLEGPDGESLGRTLARGVGPDLFFFAGSRVLKVSGW
jgi:hypothetical protein